MRKSNLPKENRERWTVMEENKINEVTEDMATPEETCEAVDDNTEDGAEEKNE